MIDVKPVERYVARGRRPQNAEDYDYLRRLGFKKIMSLEQGWLDRLTGVPNYEAMSALTRRMTPIHVHMSPWFVPRIDYVNAALCGIRTAVENREMIYVHCKDGVDRTGIVCALYSVLYQGIKPAVATEVMYKNGFHRWRFWWWVPVIGRYLKWVKS